MKEQFCCQTEKAIKHTSHWNQILAAAPSNVLPCSRQKVFHHKMANIKMTKNIQPRSWLSIAHKNSFAISLIISQTVLNFAETGPCMVLALFTFCDVWSKSDLNGIRDHILLFLTQCLQSLLAQWLQRQFRLWMVREPFFVQFHTRHAFSSVISNIWRLVWKHTVEKSQTNATSCASFWATFSTDLSGGGRGGRWQSRGEGRVRKEQPAYFPCKRKWIQSGKIQVQLYRINVGVGTSCDETMK